MPTFITRILSGMIAICVLIAFAALYLNAIIHLAEFKAKSENMLNIDYISTTLAGLVGAIVAMFFNVKLPDPPKISNENINLSDKINYLGDWLSILCPILYTVTYFIISIIAIWIVATKPDNEVPNIIKNLAFISFGMIIAIARSFFPPPPPPPPPSPAPKSPPT